MPSDNPSGWRTIRLGQVATRVQRRVTGEPRDILMITSARGFVPQTEKYDRFMAGDSLAKYTELREGEFSYNRGNSKTFPYGCIFQLHGYSNAAVPNVYISFGIDASAFDHSFARQVFSAGLLNEHLARVITSGVRGNGLLNIAPDDFFASPLPLPPLPEQKKIAAILSSVDEAIQATQAVIEQTRRVKEGLLQELLTRGMPGHTRYKSISGWTTGKIPEIDTIPDHWNIVAITDLARLESGHTPSRKVPEWWDGEINWLSLHDTKRLEDHFIAETTMKVTPEGIENSSARILPKGTVALSRTATIGKCVILGQDMATSQDFACYVCGPQLYNKYVLHLFRHMGHVWDALSGGSTHKTVYMPTFEKLQIILPPLHEQQRIATTLDSFDASAKTLMDLKDQQIRTKTGLLQDLLTGKVRVRV